MKCSSLGIVTLELWTSIFDTFNRLSMAGDRTNMNLYKKLCVGVLETLNTYSPSGPLIVPTGYWFSGVINITSPNPSDLNPPPPMYCMLLRGIKANTVLVRISKINTFQGVRYVESMKKMLLDTFSGGLYFKLEPV